MSEIGQIRGGGSETPHSYPLKEGSIYISVIANEDICRGLCENPESPPDSNSEHAAMASSEDNSEAQV